MNYPEFDKFELIKVPDFTKVSKDQYPYQDGPDHSWDAMQNQRRQGFKDGCEYAYKTGYIAGANTERNKVIDEAIKEINRMAIPHQTVNFIISKLESLKVNS